MLPLLRTLHVPLTGNLHKLHSGHDLLEIVSSYPIYFGIRISYINARAESSGSCLVADPEEAGRV